MSAEWAPTWSYQWFADIGVPALIGSLGAAGTIAVGLGAILVARSSNKVAATIAAREHQMQEDRDAAEAIADRASWAALVTRWSDRIVIESGPFWKAHPPTPDVRELRAEVDARAAVFRHQGGQDLVWLIENLTYEIPTGGMTPEEAERSRALRDVRTAFIQSWIVRPLRWLDLDDDARLTALGWVLSAQLIGRYRDEFNYVTRPTEA